MKAAGIAKSRNASARPWAPPASETGPPGRARREAGDAASSPSFALGRNLPLPSKPSPANERETDGCRVADLAGTRLVPHRFPGGKRVYVDPWLDNPKCPDSEKTRSAATSSRSRTATPTTSARSVAITQKLARCRRGPGRIWKGWLGDRVRRPTTSPAEQGRTVEAEGIKFTLTNAFHSRSADEGTYLGEAAGIVIELEDARKSIRRDTHASSATCGSSVASIHQTSPCWPSAVNSQWIPGRRGRL